MLLLDGKVRLIKLDCNQNLYAPHPIIGFIPKTQGTLL